MEINKDLNTLKEYEKFFYGVEPYAENEKTDEIHTEEAFDRSLATMLKDIKEWTE